MVLQVANGKKSSVALHTRRHSAAAAREVEDMKADLLFIVVIAYVAACAFVL